MNSNNEELIGYEWKNMKLLSEYIFFFEEKRTKFSDPTAVYCFSTCLTKTYGNCGKEKKWAFMLFFGLLTMDSYKQNRTSWYRNLPAAYQCIKSKKLKNKKKQRIFSIHTHQYTHTAHCHSKSSVSDSLVVNAISFYFSSYSALSHFL